MQITVADMRAAGLDEQFEVVETAIEAFESGSTPNVAVVSEPFAGREVLLDYAEDCLDIGAERIRFSAVIPESEVPTVDDGSVFIFDDCHYLYTRQIGGFEPLDTFLHRVALSDSLVITSWNRYAWAYLSAVRTVSRSFPQQTTVPALSANQITQLLTNHYGPDLPTFEQTDADGRVKTIGFDDRAVPLPGSRSVDVPVPELNLEYLTSRSNTAAEDTEAVVFQKLTTLSEGNPGVARVLWERSVREGTIAPGYVTEVEQPLTLDDDAAFLLSLVLMNERITHTSLSEILDDVPVERILQSLVDQGVVEVDNNSATIVPERFHDAVEVLRERRLLW